MNARNLKPAPAPVKKVAAYPIEVSILKSEGPGTLKGQIVKLTDIGFLMKVDAAQFYKVGESYQVLFALPLDSENIKVEVKVIKTYDTMEVVGKNQVKNKTIEMHFKNIAVTDRSNINSYLVKSGQKK
jgi:hypothetical protein